MPKAARESDPSNRASLKALAPILPYGLRYKARIAAALTALVIASAATLVVPLAVRRMIDFGFSRQSAGLIDAYFIGMAAVVLVLALASGARYFFVTSIGERVVADLRADLFAHLARLDATFYDSAKTGELVSRLTADTVQMKAAFGSTASVALRNVFMFVGAIAMMVYTSPKLSAFVLIVVPLTVLPLFAAGRSVRGRTRAAQDQLAEASAFAAENLGAVRTMQAFNAQPTTIARFGAAAENAYAAALGAIAARAVLTTFAIFLAFGGVVAVLWLGARDVLAGRMTGGLLSQFVLYAILGASALGQLSEVWSELSAAAGAAGRIAELLAIRPAIVAPPRPTSLADPPLGRIEFADVDFDYARPDSPVLRGVSFRVEPGERIAIVGPSGAGKTTLFQLLMRFYDPRSGSIRLDGVDLREADPICVRSRLALVAQDPAIFGETIAANIAYGRPDASERDIARAAEQAAAHQFIAALPQAYRTRIGERGLTLSGGQRQRIAIARAILVDAPILLLDEATSALDAESETLVQNALDNLMRNRTTLVIAHRLATVLKADRILVMDGGRIVEEGDHDALARAGGLYARLAKLQFGRDGGERASAAAE